MSTTIFGSPSRYVQGPNCLADAGKHIAKLGTTAFLIGGRRGIASVQKVLTASCEQAGVKLVIHTFGGECSYVECAELQRLATAASADVILGCGGGKGMDSSKVVANKMKIPIVIIPTIASSDAPCSALSVLYTPEGVVEKYEFFPANPDLVLVDTAVIAKAPVRLLVAGCGDAAATYFEARACYSSRSQNCHGGCASITALALAKLCWDTLLTYGPDALTQCRRGVAGPAFNKVVEANTLLSGLGFESGGIAAAHAIHNGLTVVEACHHYYHGEKVSFGVLTQLVLADSTPAEIEEYMAFAVRMGLPISLAQLGVDSADPQFLATDLPRVAAKATVEGETIHNMCFKVTPALVADAIMAADALGSAYLQAKGLAQ
eukprot:gnl/Dysnectes_brevis/149_a174_4747.p1 GENE.gnl/Dysnectes_brevis/149_a174_4747~~gnl/Dysnectes_brevis/149_a174_4747.p1  ORF type:complete len:376 (-),score=141.06 gnl/Dysnectes_brevis/149_a174_4747:68-1195(-)